MTLLMQQVFGSPVGLKRTSRTCLKIASNQNTKSLELLVIAIHNYSITFSLYSLHFLKYYQPPRDLVICFEHSSVLLTIIFYTTILTGCYLLAWCYFFTLKTINAANRYSFNYTSCSFRNHHISQSDHNSFLFIMIPLKSWFSLQNHTVTEPVQTQTAVTFDLL